MFDKKNIHHLFKCQLLAVLVNRHYKHLSQLESFEIYQFLQNKNFNEYRLYFI